MPPEGVDDGTTIAARLLRVARWHAGLSQEELAARAATSQQTLLRYEAGRTQPTLPTLVRVLQACSMNLEPMLVPRVEFDAPAIADVLKRAPMERIPLPHRNAVRALLPRLLDDELPFALTGKLAARLYGAPVRLYDCEFAIPPDTVRLAQLEGPLAAAGGRTFLPMPIVDGEGDDYDGTELLGRHLSSVAEAEVLFGTVADFEQALARSHLVELDGHDVPVLAVSDVMRSWHERDRDRLLLARAVTQRRRRDERRLT